MEKMSFIIRLLPALLYLAIFVSCEETELGQPDGRVHAITLNVTDITHNTVRAFGEVKLEGKSLPENYTIANKGFIFNTDPTTLKVISHFYNRGVYTFESYSKMVFDDASGFGYLNCLITDLKPETKYYVSAFAHVTNDSDFDDKNSSKVFNKFLYGEIKEFITGSDKTFVRFQKNGFYCTEIAVDDLNENQLANYYFGTNSGISPYYEIPPGNHVLWWYDSYPGYVGWHHCIDAPPHTYHFLAGHRYTIVSSEIGQNIDFHVTNDGVSTMSAVSGAIMQSKSVVRIEETASKPAIKRKADVSR